MLELLIAGLIGLVVGLVLGWFAGNQYRRERDRGSTREEALGIVKDKVEAGLLAEYQDATAKAREYAAKARAIGEKIKTTTKE